MVRLNNLSPNPLSEFFARFLCFRDQLGANWWGPPEIPLLPGPPSDNTCLLITQTKRLCHARRPFSCWLDTISNLFCFQPLDILNMLKLLHYY